MDSVDSVEGEMLSGMALAGARGRVSGSSPLTTMQTLIHLIFKPALEPP